MLGNNEHHLVGSIHSGQLNYPRHSKNFSESAIPDSKRAIVSAVKKSIIPDIMEVDSPKWNTSTSVVRKPYSEQLSPKQKQFEIRHKLREEFFHQPKLNIIFPGTELRDNFSGWNISTEINKREIDNNLKEITVQYKKKTEKTNKRLLHSYRKPSELQVHLMQKLRQENIDDESLKEKIRAEYIYENPSASEAKIASNVFRLVAKHKLKRKQDEFAISLTDDETFKPDLTKTLRTKQIKHRVHDGVWMENNAWSCCMNGNKDSAGCVVKVKDLRRWQCISFS